MTMIPPIFSPAILPEDGHAPAIQPTTLVGVRALLFNLEGLLLLGRRATAESGIAWGLPGRAVEAGDSFEAVALRVLAEETGIEGLPDTELAAVVVNRSGGRTTVIAGISTSVTIPDAYPSVCVTGVKTSWHWVDVDSPPRPLLPATAAVIAAWRGSLMPQGWLLYNL